MPTFSPMYVKALAKELRKRQTPAEAELWQLLREDRSAGADFTGNSQLHGILQIFTARQPSL